MSANLPAGQPAAPSMLPPAWRPEELAADDGGLRRGPHWLLYGVIAFLMVAFLWAAFAEIDEVVRGEGRIITTSQTQFIQNLEGGIVSKILVREGQLVEKDEILFQLDDVRFASAYKEGQQTELGLKARVARLSAEVQRTSPRMPPEVLKEARSLAENELAVYQARQRDLGTRNAVLQAQLKQREQELVELRSRRERLQEQADLARREITITAPLVKQGIVSEVELLRLEREMTRVRTDLEAAVLALPRVQSAIDEGRRKLEDNEASFRSQAAGELSTARAELAKVAESVPALEDRMERTAVRSPVKGIVKTIASRTPGGTVQPGTPLAEIVPVGDSLIVEARIRPQDIAFVSEGQKAVVKLAAYDFSIFGGLDGKVEYISADSIQPAASPSGAAAEPYYVAHIRTDKSAIDYQGKSLPVIPGMTATADVLTGRRTVLHYLLKPINKARERALTER
jgi:adhesin transport system membrane fusion protein